MIRFYIFICLCIHINQLTCDTNLHNDEHEIQLLSFKDKFNLHHAFVIEERKWRNGVVNFKIDKNFNEEEIDIILEAIYEIEAKSCIRFAAHNPSNGPNYVMIRKTYSDGCNSTRGLANQGEQFINLNINGCIEADIIIHEMMHTLGFGHHQQRSDRDYYLNIHMDNVMNGQLANFKKVIGYDDRIEFVTPFDYNSIMMYHHDTFSKNGESVMTTKINGTKITPSQRLTHYDRILLNRFYNCNSMDKQISKLFYETELGWLQFIINYHEVARAKEYSDLLYDYANPNVIEQSAEDSESINDESEDLSKESKWNSEPAGNNEVFSQIRRDDENAIEENDVGGTHTTPELNDRSHFRFRNEECLKKLQEFQVNNDIQLQYEFMRKCLKYFRLKGLTSPTEKPQNS